MTVLWVALGAGIGAPLRYLVGSRYDDRFPTGTLLVNTVASLLLGSFVGWSVDGNALALLGTGFCGGMSTYSTFAVQAGELPRSAAATYVVLTLGLGLLACAAGFGLARAYA